MSVQIFTIVAKNYLPLAHALGYSIKKYNKTNINFTIFVADSIIDYEDDIFDSNYNYVSVYDLNLKELDDISFKYTVTEFCTSIKPACFQYLFNKTNSEHFIYFDPDIFMFNDVSHIIKHFEKGDIVVTPHYLTPQVEYTGDQIDRSTLFVGIFNFGFVGFKKSDYTMKIVDWWHSRLMNEAYADIQDALHTDQKWMDFLPAFGNEKLCVSKHIGFNLAPWNLFERTIIKKEETFSVINNFTNEEYPLVFVHFAGYDPKNEKGIHKDFAKLTIDKYPFYKIIRDVYKEITESYQFSKIKNIVYRFDFFDNNTLIQPYHRRLYRAISENGEIIYRPFDSKAFFYKLLDKNNLLDNNKIEKFTSKDKSNLNGKMKKINYVFKFAFKILGANRYFTFLKYLNRYSRPENQTFLLDIEIEKFY